MLSIMVIFTIFNGKNVHPGQFQAIKEAAIKVESGGILIIY